jgi:hypothetical protein
MMKSIITPLFLLLIVSCAPKQEEKAFEQADKNFYPIKSFVKTELAELDSLPVAVFKFTTVNSKTDTTIVEKPAFRKIAEELTAPDITVPPLKENYKETVFMDETVNSVTLSYTATDENVEIQKIDVFVHPETEKVKHIYIEKNRNSGDSAILYKMMWTAGKNMQVTSIINVNNKPVVTLQEKYVWGTLE